jgi:hypothetical protein
VIGAAASGLVPQVTMGAIFDASRLTSRSNWASAKNGPITVDDPVGKDPHFPAPGSKSLSPSHIEIQSDEHPRRTNGLNESVQIVFR